MSQIVQNLSDISDQYEALFVDLWGCVHNGVEAYPAANEALIAYRKRGGKVVLVTNSPRPRSSVAEQIKEFGVSDHAWDSIATSGDSARAAMFQGVVGEAVYFIGEPRDKGFFEPLKLLEHPVQITCVALGQASGIVCTGPFDSNADPEVMLPQLEIARAKGLKFLCANPDIVVDRGAHREWCAGALAQLYTQIGGESLYFGKPFAPIYDLAFRRLKALAPDISPASVLAIGDGVQTDVKGASDAGLDALFIAGGLAARETKTKRDPDPTALAQFLHAENQSAKYTIGFLR